MLKIVTVPNVVLTIPSKLVDSFDGKLQELVKDMEHTLNTQVDPQGVGLAAPQVGVGLSLFIIKPSAKSKISVFVNPKILEMEEKKSFTTRVKKDAKGKKEKHHLEGCLSIPRIWAAVKRTKKLLLAYQTFNGEKKTEWFTSFKAVIIQHEIDHLNGILFTQRALEQKNQLYEEKKGKLVKLEY